MDPTVDKKEDTMLLKIDLLAVRSTGTVSVWEDWSYGP
jgi:hypothetical protein